MENKVVYTMHNRVWMKYEYWFLGFKRKGKMLLAELDWVGSQDIFAEYPDGFQGQLKQLETYYRGLYCDE